MVSPNLGSFPSDDTNSRHTCQCQVILLGFFCFVFCEAYFCAEPKITGLKLYLFQLSDVKKHCFVYYYCHQGYSLSRKTKPAFEKYFLKQMKIIQLSTNQDWSSSFGVLSYFGYLLQHVWPSYQRNTKEKAKSPKFPLWVSGRFNVMPCELFQNAPCKTLV